MDPTDDAENPGSLVDDLRQIIDEPNISNENQLLFTKLIASQISLYTTHRKYVEQLYVSLEFKMLASMSLLITGNKINGSLIKTSVNKLVKEQKSLEQKFGKILQKLDYIEESNKLIFEKLDSVEKSNQVLHQKLASCWVQSPGSTRRSWRSRNASLSGVPTSLDPEMIPGNLNLQQLPGVACKSSNCEEGGDPRLRTENIVQKSEPIKISDFPQITDQHIIPDFPQITDQHIIPDFPQITDQHIIPNFPQITDQHIIPETIPHSEESEEIRPDQIIPPIVTKLKTGSEEIPDQKSTVYLNQDLVTNVETKLNMSHSENDEDFDIQSMMDQLSEPDDQNNDMVSEIPILTPIGQVQPIQNIELVSPQGINGLPIHNLPLSLNSGLGSLRLQINSVNSGNHLENNPVGKIQIPVLQIIPSLANGYSEHPEKIQEKTSQRKVTSPKILKLNFRKTGN